MAIQFKVGFVADTKQLEDSLAGIQKDIANAFTIKGTMSKEIQNATREAMTLEKALKKATDTNGNISYNNLQFQLNAAGTSAAKMTATLAMGGKDFQASLNAANKALALSNRQSITLGKTMKEIFRVTTQSFKFTAAQTFLRAVSSEAQQAVRWVTDLNAAVNNIAVVTGKTGDEITKVTEQAIRGSQQLKIAAKDYAEGALIFYQQGLNDDEVTRRNEITIKASLAANQSIETMSKQLTAIWNTYGMVGEEQQKAAAVGAALAAQTAVDFKDIAEAMQSAAAPAAQMGVEYNQLAAIIATVGDVTQQSASTIGNAYKTIFSRFQQLKAEGTDGEVTLSSVSAQLKGLGIEVLDSAGNLRELGDVINEVGTNWDNWSQTQQTAIAQIVGGTRQYGQFLALMQNFDKYQKNLGTANSETGATLESQYEQALDSIDHKMEMSAESWKRAFAAMIPEEGLKTFYDMSTKIANVVETIIKGMGGLPGILALIGTRLSSKVVPALITGAKNAATFTQNLTHGGRKKGIEQDYANQRKEIDTKIAADGTSESQKQSLAMQREKLKVNEQIAQANEKINSAMNHATERQKIIMQNYKQQLQYIEQINAKSIERQGLVAQQLMQMQNLTSELTQQLELERAKAAQEQVILQEEEQALLNKKSQLQAKSGQGTSVEQARTARELLAVEEKLAQTQDKIVLGKVKIEALNNAISKSKGYDKLTNSLKNLLLELNASRAGFEGATKSEEEMRKSAEKLRNQLRTVLKDSPEQFGLTEQAVKSLMKELTPTKMKNMSLDEIVDKLEMIMTKAGLTTEALRELNAESIDAQGDRQTREEDLRKIQADPTGSNSEDDNDDSDLDRRRTKIAGIAQGMVELTSAAAGAAMTFSQLFSIFSNSDLTPLEKLQQAGTTLLFQLPLLLSSASAAGGGLLMMAKSAGVAAAAEENATFASVFLGAAAKEAWLSVLGPIALVVAAIASVIAIVFALTEAFNKVSAQHAFNEAKEAADGLREAEEAAAAEAEELRNNIEAYDSAVDKLNQCTKGTEEWKDALKEANKAALEVINSLDGLSADEIKSLYSREDGQVVLNKDKLSEIQVEKDRQADVAHMASQVGDLNLQAAQRRNQITGMVSSNRSALGAVAGGAALGTAYGSMTANPVGMLVGAISGGLLGAFTKSVEDQNIGKKISDNLDQLMGLDNHEFAEKLKEFGLNIDVTDEGFAKLKSQIEQMGEASEAAAAQMELIAQMQADEILGDSYEDAAKTIAAKQMGDNTKKIEDELYKKYTGSGISRFSGADNAIVSEMLSDFNAATGNNWVMGSNAVQGTDSNRYFSFQDENGEEHKLSARQVAATIAASKALEQLEVDAKDAAAMLANMDDVLKDFISTGNMEGATKGEFEDIKKNLEVGEDGKVTVESAQAYLESQGLTPEVAAQYAEDFAHSMDIDWDSITAKLPEALSHAEDLSLGAAKKIGTAYQTVLANSGEEAAKEYNDIFNGIIDGVKTEDIQEVQELFANIDWTQDGALEKFADSMHSIGYDIDTNTDSWRHFNATMKETYKVQPDLEQLEQTLKDIDDIVSDLSIGDIISQEDYQTLIKFNKALGEYFAILGDGSAVLVGDPLDLQQAAEGAKQESLRQAIDQYRAQEKELDGVSGSQNYQKEVNGETKNYYNSNNVNTQLEYLRAAGVDVTKWLDQIDEKGNTTVGVINEIGEAFDGLGMTSERAGALANQAMLDLALSADSAEERMLMLQGGEGKDGDIDTTSYAIAATKAINEEQWEGLDTKEVEDYAKHLQKIADKSDLVADSLEGDEEAAEDVARAVTKMNKGIDKLADGFEDWNDIITKSDEASQEYCEAMAGMKDAMSDILGVSEEFISDDFIVDNLKDIEAAATGDAEAINRLQQALAKSIIMDITIDGSQAQQDAINAHNTLMDIFKDDIQIGTKFDDTAALEGMQAVVDAAGMTVEQAQAYFNSLGYEPEFVMENKQMTAPMYGTRVYTSDPVIKSAPGPNGEPYDYVAEMTTHEEQVYMGEHEQNFVVPALSPDGTPQIKSVTKVSSGKMNNYSSANKGGGKPGSGGSKGGGGGKSYVNDAKKKEVEKPEQRYENINSQIEAVTKNLDKLSKAEEDAWGSQKTRNLRAINRELAIQNKLLERKVKEAKDYYDGDLSNLTSSSILNGAGFNAGNILVNQDGTIANPEQIKDALWETYVKPFVDAENALIGSTDEEAVKAAQQATEDNQKLYEKGLELLEKVNDSAETYHETLQQIVDNIHEMMDNMMTELESRLDFRIRVNDRDIRRIEKLMDRWGELGIMNGETYDLLTKKIESIQEKISATVAEIDNAWGILGTVENAKAGDKEAFDKIADYFNLTEENGGLAALNQWIEGNAGMPEQIMEFLIENRDNLEEMYSEIVDSTLEQLDGLFQKANKWLEDTLGKWQNTMDLNSSIIDFFDSVAEFNGAYMSNDLDNQTAARTIMTAQMSRQQADLDSKIANHNMLGNMIEAAEAAKANLSANIKDGKYNGKSIDMYDNDVREYWNKQLKAAQDAKKAAIAAGDAAAETKALTEETEIRMLMEFGAGAADMIDAQIQEWRQQQAELLPEIVNSGAELLQVATENIEKEKELAKKNIGTILGGLFTDLEDLADNYSRVKEQQDIKFDDYDQTYMTNKLQKQYDDWAENADAAGIEQMAQWQEKLNKYKETYIELDENGNEVVKHRLNMTQDEYDLLQKEFELEQLKAQFEDAQNNKNTMRLARDASGNYSYVYSSDQSQSEDNLQAIADKEYEYKKLLESIQDQTMQAAISVGEEWQNVVDNINWQLWKTDDVYRTTMIKKLQSLMMSLDEYGAKSGRIFDDLAVGVGTFGSVWDESAGEITTGATSIQNFIHDMSKALAGEGDLGEGMDESSYIGRVLGAQKYWANEANTALKDSMEDLASDEKGIPHEFGIITEGVLGAIGKISAHGEGDNGSSGYSQFVGNTEWLREQINGLLNGPENSVQGAYDALVTGTNTSLNTGNPSVTGYHNKFLENIQDIFGRPGDVNDSTVFGKYGQLKIEMAEAMDKSNEVFMNMTNDMVNWAQQSCKAIGEVIDQIAAYIAAIDQKEDAENRKLQEEAEDYTPWTQPDTPTPDVPQPAGPGTTTPTDPGPGTGGGSPSVGDRVRIKTSVTTTPSGKTWKGFVHNGVTTYKVAQVGGKGHDGQVLLYMPNYNGDFSDKGALAASEGYTGWFWASDIEGYATGGLVDSERIIKAGEEGPELVLNAEDTKNILAAVAMMRQTVAGQLGSLNTSLATSTGSLASLAAQPAPQSPQAVDQQVKIEASFPGVSVAQEIEDALNSLITQAAQYNIKR